MLIIKALIFVLKVALKLFFNHSLRKREIGCFHQCVDKLLLCTEKLLLLLRLFSGLFQIFTKFIYRIEFRSKLSKIVICFWE